MKNFFKKVMSLALSSAMTLSAGLNYSPLIQTDSAYARVGVHDPSIYKLDDGSYYIIGSHLAAARSNDLMNWNYTANSDQGTKNTTFFKDIYSDLAVPEKWSNTSSGYDLSGNLWAPDVFWNEKMQKYCMYLSVNGDNWHSSIVLCTADNIDGPYTYVDTIVYSGFETKPANSANSYKNTDVEKVLGNNPDLSRYLTSAGRWNAEYGTNAIDPCTFYDEQGNLKMVYGSWFGGIFMLDLDENTGLRDYNVKYETKTNESDAYLGKKIAGGYWSSGEGPYIEYMTPSGSSDGYYYLFLSYGYFNNKGGYNMRIFRSKNVEGPYLDENGNSAVYTKNTDNIAGNTGLRLMSNYQWSCNDRPNTAQGHNSAFLDDDGKLFVIYHNKFDDQYGFHEVRVHQLIMNEDGWITATPYEYSGETLSEKGHTMDALIGDYELIWHNPNQKFVNEQSADVEKPINITLNKDGTVTGDISATWTVTDGTPYMSFTWGGVTYKGAFIVQNDESETPVTKMTFTATGINICIWGSKKTAYDVTQDLVDRTSSGSKMVYNPADKYSLSIIKDNKLCDTELLSGIPYFITSRFNGKSLDLADGKTDEGSNIQQWTKTGGKHQEWRIIECEDNYCRIASMADENKVLTFNNGNAEISTYTGADNQLFRLVLRRGSYGIVSKASAEKNGLDVFGWSEENGGNLAEYEYWGGDCQLWNITPVYPEINESKYTIRNVNSSLFISDNSETVVQTNTQQPWTFSELPDGTYSIKDQNGKALTVKNNSAENGADVYVSDFTGDNSQKFNVFANQDGSYSILTASSSEKSCFDVYGISLEENANICQWNYWGGIGQKFIIEPYMLEDEPTVTTTTTTETTTTTTTVTVTDLTTTSAVSELIYGDANCDGKVSLADTVAVLQYIANKQKYPLSEQGKDNADVFARGDGITANDALSIQKFDAGILKELPEN